MVKKQSPDRSKGGREPKSPGNKRAIQSRKKVLEAAGRVFAKQSFHAASIRMVALEGGFPHGNIRNFFPNKASLFEEVVRKSCEEFFCESEGWIERAAARMLEENLSPPSLRQGLSFYMDRLLSFCDKNPEAMQILNLNLYQAQQPEGMPGYQHILDLLKKARKSFENLMPDSVSPKQVNQFSDAFNGLVIHFLGARSCQAQVLGMDPFSPRYSFWVKETMIAVFEPMLKGILFPETRELHQEVQGSGH